MLKIWNVYSFFVTYANIDAWTPKDQDTVPLRDRSDLDRWLLAELDHTVRLVRQELDQYKSQMAARHLLAFVDALSNWYVRRSRSRFWSEGDNADKRAAFSTLYEALVTLSRLCAPFAPFLSEAMHQNLVRSMVPSAPVSVHLTSFPQGNDAYEDEALRQSVALVRAVVGLGQRVRAETRIKVRQPLHEAIVVVPSEHEKAQIEPFSDSIAQELNVHRVVFTDEPHRYVQFELLPNFKTLGPRLGQKVPGCKAALSKADGAALHHQMLANGVIAIDVDGETIELSPDEIQVRLKAKDNFAAASEGSLVLVMETKIDEDLKLEGLAREVVNRVQRARKDLNLAYEARIEVRYKSADEVRRAIEAHRDYIAGETLATDVSFDDTLSSGSGVYDDAIDDESFCFVVNAR
ncbi:MAG: DUF5915 domain-containing protein [Polyangiales bacterium]